jgi:hypothetical protein
MKRSFALILVFFSLMPGTNAAVNCSWNDVVMTSRSTPTLQVVGNPMLRRKAPMHDGASFNALKGPECRFCALCALVSIP